MIPVDLASKIGHESMILLDPTIKSAPGSMISVDLSLKRFMDLWSDWISRRNVNLAAMI